MILRTTALAISRFLWQAACLNGNKAMVELLVDNGADLWTENEVGLIQIYNSP